MSLPADSAWRRASTASLVSALSGPLAPTTRGRGAGTAVAASLIASTRVAGVVQLATAAPTPAATTPLRTNLAENFVAMERDSRGWGRLAGRTRGQLDVKCAS